MLHRLARTLVLSALCAFGVAACGPSVHIDPLIGDDEELLRYVATTAPDVSAHPPVGAIQSLYDAMVRRDAATSWDLLSADTQAVLTAGGIAAGIGSGKGYLAAAFSDGLALDATGRAPVRVTPLEWLLAEEIAFYQLRLQADDPIVYSGTDAVVYVIDTRHQFRRVELKHERSAWRVHHPSLRLEDLYATPPTTPRTATP